MNLNNWFEKAIPAQDYIDSMKMNKEGLEHIYKTFAPPEEDEAFINKTQEKQLRAIVLTEDWCGDAMLNIPILLKFAEKATIETRMVLRDQNLELMDQYLTNGKSRSIPIFIFIDKEGNEVAKWGPRAAEVQQFVDESRSSLPPQDADEYKEKAEAMYASFQETYQSNQDFWNYVYQSIKAVL
ncbi:thioredoxin family protein [Oceanobacillus bengalensis]|uniref:Thioredoxin family protein n=1 Tax=Oceanobacillus bengalensis TaxID=1435466 RepID=A0A494YWF9_9BACI|nr:thioredoxin family protein [Oceanobacillus bengalensis]RKQ14500.1 thioredoxin family protein [Oceanobacillus bengalensis]